MAGIAFLWLGGLEGSFCLVSVGLGVGGVVGVVVVVVVVGMLAARTDMLISPTSLTFYYTAGQSASHQLVQPDQELNEICLN